MTKITCDHLEASEKSSTDDDYFFCKRVIFKNETFGCQLYSKRKKKQNKGLGVEYLGEMEKSVVRRNEGMH